MHIFALTVEIHTIQVLEVHYELLFALGNQEGKKLNSNQ